MKRQFDHADPATLLRNPVVLGAIGVVAIFLIVAGFLVMRSGSASDDGGGEPTKIAVRIPTQIMVDTQQPVSGKVTTTLNVRSGPGGDQAVQGTVHGGTEVDVVGRSADGKWLKIVYPPRSSLYGWVDARFVEIEGGLDQLPTVIPDTPTPTKSTPTKEPITPTATASPTVTTTPTPLPDLVVENTSVISGKVIVTIRNVGKSAVEDQDIRVGVFDEAGQTLIKSVVPHVGKLDAGASLDIDTGMRCSSQTQKVLVVVDVDGVVRETDDTNNQMPATIMACAPEGTPTPTPRPGRDATPSPTGSALPNS